MHGNYESPSRQYINRGISIGDVAHHVASYIQGKLKSRGIHSGEITVGEWRDEGLGLLRNFSSNQCETGSSSDGKIKGIFGDLGKSLCIGNMYNIQF